jgi:hypothetical protein
MNVLMAPSTSQRRVPFAGFVTGNHDQAPDLLCASRVRFIGFRYVTPNGLSTPPAEAFGRPGERDVPKRPPDMAQLSSRKPLSQA